MHQSCIWCNYRLSYEKLIPASLMAEPFRNKCAATPIRSTAIALTHVKITLPLLPEGILPKGRCFTPNRNGIPEGLNISR